MKRLILILTLCAFFKVSSAQLIIPADTVPAIINYTNSNGATKFTPLLRDLRPIAGAPAPFYTYFWEFGDGTFSFEKEPVHLYTDSGMFKVRLFATNNYDDGKRPPTRPKPIPIPNKPSQTLLASASPTPSLFKMGGSIVLKNNCMPKPGDDMILILGYRNKSENLKQSINGTVAILYNDKEFSNNNFELVEVRAYNNETKTDLKNQTATLAAISKKGSGDIYQASTLTGITQTELDNFAAKAAQPIKNEMENFKSSQAWKFQNLKAGKENFVFMHFKTTPQMLKDTNAVVRLSGVMIPDDADLPKEFFNIELQIVASHDPNKMNIRKTRMNYRLTGKHRELTYQVHFQNNGKGPAKKVDLGVTLPHIVDPATITVSKTKPVVQIGNPAYASQSYLSTNVVQDTVHFVFNNIYLPGSQQQGVHDADSTQGYVEYKVKFKEKPEKLPFNTQAAIVFDKNPPVYTNKATGKFKMGLSPAIIVGFGFPISANTQSYLKQNNLVLGASLAPYHPTTKYFQIELYFNNYKESSQSSSVTLRQDTGIGVSKFQITSRSAVLSSKVTTLNFVPGSFRYNFSKFVGGGVGALMSFDISNTQTFSSSSHLTGLNGVADADIQGASGTVSKSFTNVRASLFADVVVGLVRVGPAVGFRYFYDPRSNANTMTTYATWKF
jgi:hypothetical protein